MVILDAADMPTSFYGQALLYGANSKVLNPSNAGQSGLNRFVGKPIRAVARLVYQVAMFVFAAIPGIFYHLAAAAKYAVRYYSATRLHEMSRAERPGKYCIEHFKAALQDSVAIVDSWYHPFCFNPNESMFHFLSDSLAQFDFTVDETDMRTVERDCQDIYGEVQDVHTKHDANRTLMKQGLCFYRHHVVACQLIRGNGPDSITEDGILDGALDIITHDSLLGHYY